MWKLVRVVILLKSGVSSSRHYDAAQVASHIALFGILLAQRLKSLCDSVASHNIVALTDCHAWHAAACKKVTCLDLLSIFYTYKKALEATRLYDCCRSLGIPSGDDA